MRMLIIATALALLAGCAAKPTPLKAGVETTPPHGCIEYRARGGRC